MSEVLPAVEADAPPSPEEYEMLFEDDPEEDPASQLEALQQTCARMVGPSRHARST